MLIAVFDNQKSAESGMDRLEEQGIPSGSIRFVGGAQRGRSRPDADANEAGSEAIGEAAIAEKNAPFLPPGSDPEAPLDELHLDQGVREYLQGLLSEGARVLTVEVEEADVDGATQALRDAGATQVTTSDE